jgi:hypothetical protein
LAIPAHRHWTALSIAVASLAGCLDFNVALSTCEDGGRCAAAFDGGTDSGPPDAGATDSGQDGGGDAGLADAGVPPDCCSDGNLCLFQPFPNASGQAMPQGIAVDAEWIYWVTLDGTLWHAPTDGGPSLILKAAGVGPSYRVAVSPTAAFWVADAGVFRVNLDGGGFTLLASDPLGLSSDFISDSTNLYWTDDNNVWTLPQSGDGGATKLFHGASGCCLQVDTQRVYWGAVAPVIESGSLMGGPFGPLVNEAVTATAIDSSFLYWATREDGGTHAIGRIGTAPDASSVEQELGSFTGSVSAMVVDANAVYWLARTPNQGWLLKKPLDGGPQVCLSSELISVDQLAQDAQHLYWTEDIANGHIRSIPK